jgi:hypothetical protein
MLGRLPGNVRPGLAPILRILPLCHGRRYVADSFVPQHDRRRQGAPFLRLRRHGCLQQLQTGQPLHRHRIAASGTAHDMLHQLALMLEDQRQPADIVVLIKSVLAGDTGRETVRFESGPRYRGAAGR